MIRRVDLSDDYVPRGDGLRLHVPLLDRREDVQRARRVEAGAGGRHELAEVLGRAAPAQVGDVGDHGLELLDPVELLLDAAGGRVGHEAGGGEGVERGGRLRGRAGLRARGDRLQGRGIVLVLVGVISGSDE